MIIGDRMDGVVIGVFLGLQDGKPLVVFAGNPEPEAITARSLVALDASVAGCEVALLFEDGERDRPLIIGRIIQPEPKTDMPTIIRDGENLRSNAQERIELRVGKASIVMEKDGHIIIRGSYLVSHASAANRIRGGSVNLN